MRSLVFGQAATEYGGISARGVPTSDAHSTLDGIVGYISSASPAEWAMMAGGVLLAIILIDRILDRM